MTNAKRKPFLTTRELATVAILAAISAVLFMIEDSGRTLLQAGPEPPAGAAGHLRHGPGAGAR